MTGNPGEIAITNCMIVSPRTSSWNFAPNCLTASIVESIFIPGVTAEFKLIDYQDYLANLQLTGDELINFSWTKLYNGAQGNYSLHLNSIKFLEASSNLKTKTYELQGVSREALTGQGNQVQQGFNTQISNMVQTLLGQLNSSLPIIAEETMGMINHKIASQPIYHAIEMLRKEAVSNSNKSSNFMFYLTQFGMYFQTMENMINNGDVKEFTQTNTVGHFFDIAAVDTNILAWQIVQNMDAVNRLKSGALNQRVGTFNTHTNEYVRGDFKPNVSEFNNLGAGSLITDAFQALFPLANRAILRFVHPNQNLNIAKSNVPDNVAYKMLNTSQMQEMMMRMTCIGEPTLEAGKTITCNVPEVAYDNSSGSPDQQMSGRWLMSKIEHNIQEPDVKPRYLVNIEGLKGNYEDSI